MFQCKHAFLLLAVILPQSGGNVFSHQVTDTAMSLAGKTLQRFTLMTFKQKINSLQVGHTNSLGSDYTHPHAHVSIASFLWHRVGDDQFLLIGIDGIASEELHIICAQIIVVIIAEEQAKPDVTVFIDQPQIRIA
jgi:hypothetical protein